MREYQVRALWDPEVSVCVAQSEDVPGLVTEAETVEQLIAKLQVMVPELLDATEAWSPRRAGRVSGPPVLERTWISRNRRTSGFRGRRCWRRPSP
jgi:hypothetical protein